MMTPEQIKDALQDRRLNVVSEVTGLHWNTLKDIRDGNTKNPSWSTMKVLSEYLEGKSND